MRGVKGAEDIAGRLQPGSHDQQHSHYKCTADCHKSSTPQRIPADAVRADRAYDSRHKQADCAGKETNSRLVMPTPLPCMRLSEIMRVQNGKPKAGSVLEVSEAFISNHITDELACRYAEKHPDQPEQPATSVAFHACG